MKLNVPEVVQNYHCQSQLWDLSNLHKCDISKFWNRQDMSRHILKEDEKLFSSTWFGIQEIRMIFGKVCCTFPQQKLKCLESRTTYLNRRTHHYITASLHILIFWSVQIQPWSSLMSMPVLENLKIWTLRKHNSTKSSVLPIDVIPMLPDKMSVQTELDKLDVSDKCSTHEI